MRQIEEKIRTRVLVGESYRKYRENYNKIRWDRGDDSKRGIRRVEERAGYKVRYNYPWVEKMKIYTDIKPIKDDIF